MLAHHTHTHRREHMPQQHREGKCFIFLSYFHCFVHPKISAMLSVGFGALN